VIFPLHCKEVGVASTCPCGERVYFLSRYLIHQTGVGYEVLEIEPDMTATGLMRDVARARVIASPDEVGWYPEPVNIYDRARLVRLATESGYRCTIFTGRDEHTTFILDPDISAFLTVHVYDNTPPLPALSTAIREQEECGLFGGLGIVFRHHIHDLRQMHADVFPCHASGFSRTLDTDPMKGGERVAGCLTGAQLYQECYGSDFTIEEICPLHFVEEEPFIARCCRREREGAGMYRDRFGVVVHWGAEPYAILQAVYALVENWRKHEDRPC
jgi:hypothetical protein